VKDLLNRLKDIALRFQIDPFQTLEHAAKVNTVLKVLSDINRSYYNFLEIEFLKNEGFRIAYEKNSRILETFKEDLDLLIVDVKFSSFEAALAPNLIEAQSPIFKNEVVEWKHSAFENYKEMVIEGDYNDSNHLKKVVGRYSDEERLKIFHPFFSSLGDGKSYRINIKTPSGEIIKTLRSPERTKLEIYAPRFITGEVEDLVEEKNYLVYAKIKKKGKKDEVSFSKRNIKKVHYIEELAHDTYPFKPNILQYRNLVFILSKRLECAVSFDSGTYIIESPELDIMVWGENREAVEEAFSFSFYSLYETFYLEDDKRLSKEAIVLKKKLKKIIKSVVENEAKKK
jgi:hypothetical protein